MFSIFIDRKDALGLFEEEWKKKKGRLIILYGRRRIGKSRLLREFMKDKKGVYYIAEDISYKIQINQLQEKLATFLQDDVLKKLEIQEWDTLFAYIAKNIPQERIFLILDEFSYLIKNNDSILSVVQKYWDTDFNQSELVIILTGSLVGLMNDQVLSQSSPLYGRRTRDILLEGLRFEYARKFLSIDEQQTLELYLTIGGVPEYLLKAGEYTSHQEFIMKEFLHKYGYFYREPYFILSQELKELKNYFSILNAIAYGNTRPTEIANFVGIEARGIYPYLETLQRLGIIEREVPIFGNTKKGIYIIVDHIFDFWFNFVFKRREQIEEGSVRLDENELSRYLGKKFERFVVQEVIPVLYPNYTTKGRWWYKDQEIDVIVVKEDQREIILLEVKWSNVKLKRAEEILKKLKIKALGLQKITKGFKEQYGLIVKTIEKKEELRKKGFEIYDLEEIMSLLHG